MKRIKDYFLEDESLQCGVFTHENPYTKVMIKRYSIDSYNVPKGYIFDNDSGKRIPFLFEKYENAIEHVAENMINPIKINTRDDRNRQYNKIIKP